MDSELQEKEMIHEEYPKDPFTFWMWLFIVAVIVIVVSTVQTWYDDQMKVFREESPFFRVTNRQFSLFLWENPQFMRVNVSSKEAYLPGFQYIQKVTPKPELADAFVQAPPPILFHYHTWKRLIGDEISRRKIPRQEFVEFVTQAEEWQPKYWPQAPKGYSELFSQIMQGEGPEDLAAVPQDIFPLNLRLSFIGWKNFFKEGEAINAMQPTFKQLDRFIDKNPTFARNYWRNLVGDSDPSYLYAYSFLDPNPDALVPKQEITPFLRVALFNFLQSLEGN